MKLKRKRYIVKNVWGSRLGTYKVFDTVGSWEEAGLHLRKSAVFIRNAIICSLNGFNWMNSCAQIPRVRQSDVYKSVNFI